MRTLTTLIALLCTLTMTANTDKAKKLPVVTLKLVETSDVHGAFFPYNYVEQKPMKGTMARVSTYLKRLRAEYGKNVIALDNGDILQGQPTCYYTNFVATQQPNIAAEVINYMKFDAETFGNHDVETGHAVYDKWISEVKCPMLGANIIDVKTGKPYVEPYLLLERQGVRIAVLGMLTPAIPNWLNESLWTGIRFEEMVGCARKWVKILKEKEQADVIVGLFHSGWEGGIVTPDYEEDCAQKIAAEVEGFDVIFYGHDHRARQVTMPNGVLCLDPSNNALQVAEATLTLVKTKGRWTVKHKEGQLVNVADEEIDADFMRHFEPQMRQVSDFVGQYIGRFERPMLSRDAFFGSSSFTDLIHRLQLEETKADVSFNAPLQFNTEIKAGDIHMSDMFKLYRYENRIYMLRMTGEEIRRHLEMSYDLWVNTMKTPDDHIMLLNDAEASDQQRLGFKNLYFNFDSAAGIDYEVDVTKPDGEKVRILQFSDGRPFELTAWYRVAMNSYRGNGGGELLTRGAGIPMDSIPQRIIYQSPLDQRHYLAEMIRRQSPIDAQPLNNWRFVPDAWAKPALERDRKLLFKK